jgi:hypothetical protein
MLSPRPGRYVYLLFVDAVDDDAEPYAAPSGLHQGRELP